MEKLLKTSQIWLLELICYGSQPQKTDYGGIKTSDCIIGSSSSTDVLPGSPTAEPPYKTSTKLMCGEQSLLTCARVICIIRQVNLNPLVTVEVAYNVTVLSGKHDFSFFLFCCLSMFQVCVYLRSFVISFNSMQAFYPGTG